MTDVTAGVTQREVSIRGASLRDPDTMKSGVVFSPFHLQQLAVSFKPRLLRLVSSHGTPTAHPALESPGDTGPTHPACSPRRGRRGGAGGGRQGAARRRAPAASRRASAGPAAAAAAAAGSATGAAVPAAQERAPDGFSQPASGLVQGKREQGGDRPSSIRRQSAERESEYLQTLASSNNSFGSVNRLTSVTRARRAAVLSLYSLTIKF